MYKKDVFKLGEFALEAMMKEVACYPAFGLVSPVTTGSHSDMNHYTFIESSAVLYRYFLEMADTAMGIGKSEDIFKRCRRIGIEAEEAMYKKTKGINTHKGMIFVLGLTLIATGIVLKEEGKFEEISMKISEMTKGIVEAELGHLSLKKKPSHGEKVFLEYGISGIRGEVENGIPTVFEHGLGVYERINLSENERLIYTLLEIMAYCDDTTILHRHDLDTLREVRRRSRELLDTSVDGAQIDPNLLKELDQDFSRRKISPGGCADLLAVTIFLNLIKKEYFTKNA